MRLLISTYACAPNLGSEHAVGWNWTTEAHRQGHQVWALASPAHREAVEKAGREDPDLRGIHWTFPEVRLWPLRPATEPKWERTYNLLWQRAALCHARELQRRVNFDAIHHLTWAGIRAPTFLGSLGVPLIIGPIGGGETSPPLLRDRFPLRGKILENLRDLSNSTINLNPLVRRGLRNAAVIFVTTSDTRNLLSHALQEKTVVFTQVSIHRTKLGKRRAAHKSPPRLLYAGRLLYWKGVHIAIQAFAKLLTEMPNARFTIVGNGPEETRLKADVLMYKIKDSVDFISWLPQERLFDLYQCHDLLIFPSLHDSGGFVALEALGYGMPVVCLDLGGPRYIVTPNSGVIIKTSGLNTAQVASRMAREICDLFTSPVALPEMSAGAISRAKEFILSNRVAQFYREARSFIELTGTRSVSPVAQSGADVAVAPTSRESGT